MFAEYQPYFIAIALGLLIGIERERSKTPLSTMGVRTFILVSLFGALAGAQTNQLLAVAFAFFAFVLIAISYSRQSRSKKQQDMGLTTEFAAGLTFCLGVYAHQAPAFSAALGVFVSLILFSKKQIHRFTKNLKATEIESAIFLALLAVVVINLVPDQTIDPYKIFNPKKFGYLVLILAALEFASYVMIKIFGQKRASLMLGFFGGIISSTAVTLSSAKEARKFPENWGPLVCAAIVGQVAALLEVLFIVGLISIDLLVKLLLPISCTILFCVISTYVLARKSLDHRSDVNVKSPLEWKAVFRLAILFAIILSFVSMAKIVFGDQATYIVSLLSGFFELHGVTLANATMFHQGQLSLDVAAQGTVIAVVASLVAKIVLSWIFGKEKFSRALSLVFGVAMTISLILFFFASQL